MQQGMCAEKTAADLGITRAQQDEFAILSYKRAGEDCYAHYHAAAISH